MSGACCGDDESTRPILATTITTQAPTSCSTPDDDCCAPQPVKSGSRLVLDETVPWWRDRTLGLPAASGAFLAAGLLLDRAGSSEAAVVLEAAALSAGAATFVPGALRRLVRRKLGVGLLMTIAAVGAVALGRVEEAAALAFLFSIAEALESRAMTRAQRGLRALLALIPDQARLESSAGDRVVDAADLRVGDVIVIGAGDRLPTDGTVLSGSSSLDTSAVTGESIPVFAGPGDEVVAGAVNGSGSLRVRATADGRDNSLTQIVRLVEEAHARKGDRARLADQIARPLVPAILVLAASVALLGVLFDKDAGLWLERALVVLVAASPCALAIAVPVTVISAIGSASKLGIVIKSGQAFELLGTVRMVAFDKTGTLTRNQPQVTEVHVGAGVEKEEVVTWAAALEAASSHPLGHAIASHAAGRLAATDVQEHPGLGITGIVDRVTVRVGSSRWIRPGPFSDAVDSMTERGMSVVLVERSGSPVGVIGVRDELRPEAADAVAQLHARGVGSMMLTGDNRRTAEVIAAQAGIADVRAEQLPGDKASAVERAERGGAVAMVGDGINDAPALASATVGIAMGATGSAAAVESADVAFTGTDLRQIPRALQHARRGRRIMTANIVLSLAIIAVLVPLAILGVLGLAEVVLVHEAAEVVVILNALRAARLPADESPAGDAPADEAERALVNA